MKKILIAALMASLLSGCGAAGRLKAVGKAPKMSPTGEAYAPDIEPSLGEAAMARGRGAQGQQAPASSASLFRAGGGALFQDQRAARLGDILTIRINIQDKASVDNSTSRSRTGNESAGIGALLGLQNTLKKVLPGNDDTSKLVDASSTSTSNGAGNTTRSEQINMTVAAIVTQVLPNGNLMIRGKQEVRVNFELRELVVTGIVRPQDIARDNSIRHSQIAEARVIYGGRGQLTDVQQARWGQQIYDALFPF
ncbi:MAG TPA: flagellar basal body L-ring protein FlgH [Allosphingosinicella sp.]|jgi:flagellar L-ring protein precursor FlgH